MNNILDSIDDNIESKEDSNKSLSKYPKNNSLIDDYADIATEMPSYMDPKD